MSSVAALLRFGPHRHRVDDAGGGGHFRGDAQPHTTATARTEALCTLTLQLVQNWGLVSDRDQEAFLDAGYTRRQMLEVVLAYSQQIMSNYTNHLANTPLDKPFRKFAWESHANMA